MPKDSTKVMASYLTPLPLKPNPKWQQEMKGRLSRILTLMEIAEDHSPIGAEELLRKGYQARTDIGPMRKGPAIAALSEAWREARSLGLFNDKEQFGMKITRGPDAGKEVVIEHVLGPDMAPDFSCEFANIRLRAPSKAVNKNGETALAERRTDYMQTLNAIRREQEGIDAPAKLQEARWKQEMASDGAKALELPRMTLRASRVIATPSSQSDYRWKVQTNVINVSTNATEVELECVFLGRTHKYDVLYIMGEAKQTLHMRRGQDDIIEFQTPLKLQDYKNRTDEFEKLNKIERRTSEVHYLGTLFRLKHAKGVVLVEATHPALIKVWDEESEPKLSKLPRLYADPKTWAPLDTGKSR